LLGIELIDNSTTQGNEYVKIRAMAGVGWDYFVAYSVEHGLFGLENLSLIPGTVGASPIQNIGAYGVEVRDFIDYVEAYDIKARKFVVFHNVECQFKYRDSMFKHEGIGHYIIIAVVFKLLRNPNLVVSYGDVKQQMAAIINPTAKDLRQCIIKIRQSKLPDPKLIGNVGSFFHNPILNNDKIELLKHDFFGIPVYAVDDAHSKVSAGWTIDNLGLKGYRQGNLGIYAKQALVIVNYAGTDTDTGVEVTKIDLLEFARMVQQKVQDKYGIELNIEPIIIK
jgi:UDP-N-acetylmuramate dehydrogenase